MRVTAKMFVVLGLITVLPNNQQKQCTPFGRRTGLKAGRCHERYGAEPGIAR
jgi:hypothetical protein